MRRSGKLAGVSCRHLTGQRIEGNVVSRNVIHTNGEEPFVIGRYEEDAQRSLLCKVEWLLTLFRAQISSPRSGALRRAPRNACLSERNVIVHKELPPAVRAPHQPHPQRRVAADHVAERSAKRRDIEWLARSIDALNRGQWFAIGIEQRSVPPLPTEKRIESLPRQVICSVSHERRCLWTMSR